MSHEQDPLKILYDEEGIVGDAIELEEMDLEDYKAQLNLLFPLNYYERIRLTQGGPYITTTKEQVDALIAHLESAKKR